VAPAQRTHAEKGAQNKNAGRHGRPAFRKLLCRDCSAFRLQHWQASALALRVTVLLLLLTLRLLALLLLLLATAALTLLALLTLLVLLTLVILTLVGHRFSPHLHPPSD